MLKIQRTIKTCCLTMLEDAKVDRRLLLYTMCILSAIFTLISLCYDAGLGQNPGSVSIGGLTVSVSMGGLISFFGGLTGGYVLYRDCCKTPQSEQYNTLSSKPKHQPPGPAATITFQPQAANSTHTTQTTYTQNTDTKRFSPA